MKTNRFSLFALILLVIVFAQLGNPTLSPVLHSESPTPTGTPSIPAATQTATTAPTPTVTPTPQAEYLFNREVFPSCMTSQVEDGFRSYSLGAKLDMEISTSEYEYIICDEREFSDFVMEADITLVDATPANVKTTFIFRHILVEEYEKDLEFGLTNGLANLFYYDSSQDDAWTTLIDYTPVPVFNETSSNHLKVMAIGDTYIFFVNGAFIGQVQDSHLSSGSVGVALTNWATEQTQHVVYENLALLDLSAPKLRYEETDFVSGGCFGEGSGDGYETFAENEQYHVNLTAGTYFVVPCQGAGLDALTDFILEMDVTPETSGYPGLAFRTNTDTGTMYIFQISPDGSAYLSYLPTYNDTPVTLVDWVPTGAAFPVGESVHLRIIAIGDSILIYANGYLAAQVQDASISSGGITLVANAQETDANFIFDNLKVINLVAP